MYLILLSIFLLFNLSSQLKEGDSCGLFDTQLKCVNSTICEHYAIKDSVMFGIQVIDCSVDGTLVCCEIFLSKSDEMCAKYGEEVKHLRVYPIVGGSATSVDRYPHMAALGFGNKSHIEWNCGGSLISTRFVLTAAHCLKDSSGYVKFVRMGASELNSKYNNDSRFSQDFEVIRRIPHPEYKPPSGYNDIALLELNKDVEFSAYVKPACLHTKISKGIVVATGWGFTEYLGNRAAILQRVELDHFNNTECNKSYRNQRRKVLKGILEDRMVCAGGRDAEKDTCQGDSGGPIQVYRFEEGLSGIIGVTAFGKACGVVNLPSVYTRVKYYVPWIENIVWP